MKGRGVGFWVVLAVLLLASALLLGRGRTEGPPLDPAATNALGTRALTELLDDLGGDVSRRLPQSGDDVALVLVDRDVTVDQRAIERWVRNGGTAVIADSRSWLSPTRSDLADDPTLDRATCTIAGLDDVDVVAADRMTRFEAVGERQCFGDGSRAFIVAEAYGDGTLLHVGDPYVFTNEYLDEEDNAVLAARLLLPTDGASVAIVYDAGAAVGDGNETLGSLIPTRVRWFALQLTLAFGLLVLWRARRFGRFVTEPVPVEMPGSLLVQASGELRRRSKGHAEAIEALRSDLDRRLRIEFRVPSDRSSRELVEAVAERSSLSRLSLEEALVIPYPSTSEGLVAIAAAVDVVAAAVLRATEFDTRPDTDPDSLALSPPESSRS